MIITRTPLRVSFFGGGTDFPEWYEKNNGITISFTFNKYCYVTLRKLSPLFNFKYRLRYFKNEFPKKIPVFPLSNLIQEWGILKREIFIIIWAVIFILCGLYLVKQSNKRINSHLLFGFVFIISGIIMSSGIPNNSSVKLSMLSGLLPPEFYSIYNSENDCPLGLDCYKDFDEGLKISKELNKPMLIDFTGWACANCRRVEENTWSDPEIFDYLNNDVVLISLYVDDRSLLEDKNVITLRDQYGNSKILESIGQKWSAFQTLNFNINSQPYYVLVSPDLEILNTPIQYVDTETYRSWITSGLRNYTLK